ncbi:hypothetical protein NMY22_g15556 [Coprinellus aureogranulatus]|nr:hypothetical protein NMY22_g15556 [Coprinellus aureogranulatus]
MCAVSYSTYGRAPTSRSPTEYLSLFLGQPGQGESAQSSWLCIRLTAQPLVAVLGKGLRNTMMRFNMLDMKAWSMELQTARSQKAYEQLNISVQLASITILYYDYALTFLDEIEYIWSKPRKLTTLFYVFCRYSLIANPLYLLSISTNILEVRLPDTPSAWSLTVRSAPKGLVCFSPLTAISAAVWGLRTSAIYDKHKVVSVFLGLLGTSVIVLLIIRAPFNQCHGPVKFQWCVFIRLLGGMRFTLQLGRLRGALAATMLFYEVSAWLLAVLRAWRTVREDVKFWDNPKQSLNYIIFSQGLTYISAVFLLSMLSITLNFQVNLIFTRMLNSVKVPLSGVLTARFLIQLRKWESKRTRFDSRNSLPSYDPNVSTHIHFTDGGDPTVAPGKSGSPLGISAIHELGKDIGPKPRTVVEMDGEDSDTGIVEVEAEEVSQDERARRSGKSRQSDSDDALETPSVQGDSPVSALFSAGNISRRTKQRSSPIESSQRIAGSSFRRTLDTSRTQGRIQPYVKSTHHD